MLRRHYLVLVAFILVLSSCTSIDEADKKSKLKIENAPTVTAVDMNNGQLLSFDYQIKNESNQTIGPLYVNYVFHDYVIKEYLALSSYSLQQSMGLEGITLKAGEAYRGGDNIEVKEEISNLQELEKAITDHQSIEIQFIDITTNEIVSSEWIRHFYYVNETDAAK